MGLVLNNLQIIYHKTQTNKWSNQSHEFHVFVKKYIIFRWNILIEEYYELFQRNPGSSTQKTAAVLPLTSHLNNHPSKMNKTCWTCWRSKWRSFIDLNTLTCLRWPTNKNLFTSALCGHSVQFGRPVGSDRRWEGTKRVSQGNPCCQHDLIMMMMVIPRRKQIMVVWYEDY